MIIKQTALFSGLLLAAACNPFFWQETGEVMQQEGQIMEKEAEKFEPKKAKISMIDGEESIPIYCTIWEF